MPPSGYNYNQAESVCEFFRSCVGALIEENRGIRSPADAILREINSITRDLKSASRLNFEQELLSFTKSFYESLLKNSPDSLDMLSVHAEDVLAELHLRILAIHVAV